MKEQELRLWIGPAVSLAVQGSSLLAIVETVGKKPAPERLTRYYVENPSLFISVLFLDWWNGVKAPFVQRVAF
ncbi:Uncharacterised protein [Vibrio cholerae]|uniref:Uncharacterized protein n=1 Tax=Vibrio cholerae TaxID=666 RepID=A0A656A4A2_VIBCL|nr:Uncharacterised protein [Vibrio cholerae]CSC49632.1 Uncharacterised protein [Vibrio cholerae]CSC92448.1 Uncharacterised protein [Vibrio cholerae]